MEMKRLWIPVVLLIIVAVLVAGCGGSEGAATNGGTVTDSGGPVGQAEASAGAANRKMISAALPQYENL
jgi:hypothetical protein